MKENVKKMSCIFVSAALAATSLLGTVVSADGDLSGSIRVVTSANSGRPGLEAIAPLFEEATGVSVQAEFGDTGTPTYTASLMTELENGAAADVFACFAGTGTSSPNLGSLVEAGVTMDLTDTEYGQRVWDGNLDSVMVDDKIYGVCLGVQFSGIIYNTELFEEYGLTVPTTWDELLTLVAKIKEVAPDKIPVSIAGGHSTMAMIAASMLVCEEPSFTKDITSFSEDEAWNAGLNKLMELQEAGAFSDSVATDDTNAVVTQMVSGSAFMLLDLTSRYAAIKRADAECPIAMAPMPTFEGGEQVMMLWPGTMFAVNADSENPDAAVAFINYITEAANNKVWIDAAGGSELTPAQATGEDETPEQYTELAAVEKTVMIPCVTWDGPEASNTLGDDIPALLTGMMSVEEVLAAMDEAAE